ncbi:MAG: hypothetical protein JWL94_1486 [Microbacteriaceae bacterium]|jgi:hypothetical protein|nr:hypothetical protein [Microbacteriaceae bacterium]
MPEAVEGTRVTDNDRWQSPSGSGTPPEQPAHSAPVGPPQPNYPQHQSGWTPPPKPGLIPLRPLEFGTILGAPYRVLRRNPRPTFGVSLLIQGSVLFITFLVVGVAAYLSFSRIDFEAPSTETDQLIAGAFGVTLLTSLVPIALSVVATGVMQGMLVLEAARQSVGEKLRFAQLWALAKGRVWAVAGYAVALSIALLLAIALIVGAVAVPALLGDAGIAVALAVLLGLGLIVVGAWIGTKLAFVPSVIMLERTSIAQAIRRSWGLTDQVFWKMLGTLLLVTVIINVASSIVTAPVQVIGSLLPALLAPTGDVGAMIATAAVLYLVLIMVSLVISAIALVIQSATTALLYIDQRMRKEGLDLELARYVEARQTGATDVADPYVALPGGGSAGSAASPWA